MSEIDEHDARLGALVSQRPRLTNLAYRFLGSLTDAEDAVQETYTRWFALSAEQQAAIASPPAWLSTVVSRVCLDQLGSARARREKYVGQWLPEPVPDVTELPDGQTVGSADPADRITLDESIDMAFLILLESMTPAERVSFLLHDVFRYPFAEVAEIVGRTPAACRQLASSARRRVRAAQPVETPVAQQAGLVRSFKQAWETKDVDALVGLLDPAATVVADGGGVVAASLVPVEGAVEIARYFTALAARVGSMGLHERTVNGRPGLVAVYEGMTAAVFAFEIASDRIQRIWAVRNPQKLTSWTDG